MRAERNKKKKKRKWLKITGVLILLLVFATGGYATYLYTQAKDSVEKMQGKFKREKSDKRGTKVDLAKGDPFSVLLMGVDERNGDKGRADTMILMTVNPKKEAVSMTSIPRDTRTTLVGRGTEDKLNHSYAFGGVEMTVKSVEAFLNVPVDYYVKVNMDGFRDIVDAVGGITVESPQAFTIEGHSYSQGTITLNGTEALPYARMRYDDPKGDIGREGRQRQVIEAIIKKAASVSSITRVDKILNSISKNTETNLTFGDVKLLQKNYLKARNNMESFQLEGKGEEIEGVYYLIIPDENRQKARTFILDHLDIKK